MLVRLNVAKGGFAIGMVVDAAVSPDGNWASAYDQLSGLWAFCGRSEFTLVSEENLVEKHPDTSRTSPLISLRDLLGQDVKGIEFK